MSRFNDVISFATKYASENGRGLSPNDALSLMGRDDPDYLDPAVRNAVKTQLRRAVKKGGSHRWLVEKKIILPGLEDRGEWTDGLDRVNTTVPVTIESRAFAPLRQVPEENIKKLPEQYKQQFHALVSLNLTGRKGTVVSTYGAISITEYRAALDKIALLESAIKEKDGEIKFLRSLINKGTPALAAE